MADFIRVRDTRTNEILPDPVPENWLDIFDHLKEVPSSASERARVTGEGDLENLPPVRAEEPVNPKKAGTPVTEPAKPEKEAK